MNSRWLLLFLLLSPAALLVNADEDEVEEDAVVDDEDGAGGADDDAAEEDDGSKKVVHVDADTFLLFTKPRQISSAAVELPGGQPVEFLVGFKNKGEQQFTIEHLDASFRYPQDWSYHIQNFSAIAIQKTVKPKQEATVAYSFMPADAFAGRPIGLSINLAYRDAEGNFYFDPVFNETVQIIEFDEGFDTEVFFMWVFMIAIALLVLFLGYSMLGGKSKGSKKSSAPARPVETGTAGDDVDYEWIPRSALRTPGSSKTSPRQRKGKKGAGSDTE